MRLRLKVILRVSALAFAIVLGATGTRVLGQCEVQRLSTDDTAPYYTLNFGASAAIGESYAVVAATFGGFGPIDVNSGYVYVYQLVDGRWIEEVRLSPSDGTLTDGFARSVSISGDRIIVGARGAPDGGGAYIFHRTDIGWVEEAKLLQWDDDPSFDMFGESVSISGDVAVIGDALADEIATDAGAAYVFRRTKAGWLPEQKLTGSDATVNDGFGWSLAVDGDTILVASLGHEHGVKGSGWAYVFRYDGTDWVEEDHFTGADTAIGDHFGIVVALTGDRALVGAHHHDDPAENIGAAYVFRREATKWVQEAKLVPQDGQSGDLFAGASLAFNGRHAMVAPSWLGPSFGRAYIFERSETSWDSSCRLTPGGGNPVALSREYAFVRARDSVFVYSLLGPCYSLVNHASFQRCFSDEGRLPTLGCEEFDVDLDGDVDLDDYARFREHLVGPGDSCQ